MEPLFCFQSGIVDFQLLRRAGKKLDLCTVDVRQKRSRRTGIVPREYRKVTTRLPQGYRKV